MLHIYFTPYFTYEVFSEVTIFYVNNPETIQRIKYIKQQYKIYPTVLFFLRQTVFSLHFSDFFFFYLGFLSQPFTNHRTTREGGEHFFNFSLPLSPASQTLRH